jgi:hypothetical protein
MFVLKMLIFLFSWFTNWGLAYIRCSLTIKKIRYIEVSLMLSTDCAICGEHYCTVLAICGEHYCTVLKDFLFL